jgi:hypothetical protein
VNARVCTGITYALAFLGAVTVGMIAAVLLDDNGFSEQASRAFGFCLTSGFIWLLKVQPASGSEPLATSPQTADPEPGMPSPSIIQQVKTDG